MKSVMIGVRRGLLVLVVAATAGCVSMATNAARKEGVAQCKKDGKVFAERDATTQGGMFGTVAVSGSCLGPDDPGYAEALAKSQASKKK